MGLADDIIAGRFNNPTPTTTKKKKKEESISDSIINGTLDNNKIRSVASTIGDVINTANDIRNSVDITNPLNMVRGITGLSSKASKENIKKAGGDLVNLGVETGKGVFDFVESGIYDPILQASSSKYNPGMYIADDNKSGKDKVKDFGQVLLGDLGKETQIGMAVKDIISSNPIKAVQGVGKLLSKTKADDLIEDAYKRNKSSIDSKQAIAQELISDNSAQRAIDDTLGYGKVLSDGRTVQQTLDDNANLIKSDNIGGKVIRGIGRQIPSMMVGANVGEAGSLGTMALSSYGGGLQEAYQNGATREEANRYGLATTAVETATEKMFAGFGGVIGKGPLDDSIQRLVNDKIKNKVAAYIVNYGLDMLGEGVEEVAADILNPIAKKLTYASEADLKKLYEDENFLEDFLIGSLSSGVMKLTSAPFEISNMNQQIQQERQQNLNNQQNNLQMQPNQVQNLPTQEVLQENNQTPIEQQTPQITPLNEVRNNDIADTVRAMNLEEQPSFRQKQGNYVYEVSDNSKIDNLRKDAANYFKEGEQTSNYINMLEKIISDKDVEIRFNPNLRDSNGRIVNGTYSNGVITLNPNSNRAGEFLAIHELTHAIGTKSMIDMIQTYRKSNAEFNSAVERLLSTYNTTEINEEAMADIAGQLFGNQEYINNLAATKPSLFRRMYNEIKYLWHQFTGYKNQDQFIEDLRNKWESAYRNQKVQQKAKNSNIEMSNQTDSNGNQLSNEQVEYFKNSKVRDKDGNLLVMYHGTNEEFNVFKPSKWAKEISGDNQIKGYFATDNSYSEIYGKTNPYYLNINNPLYMGINGQEAFTLNEWKDFFKKHGIDDIKFDSSLYGVNTKGAFSDADGNTRYLAFEIVDSDEYWAGDGNVTEKIKQAGYDGLTWTEGGTSYMPFESNQIKNIDNLTPTKSDDIRYSKEEISNKDSQGRELSKQQQEYFKDTKVRDNEGNLKVMYHGTPDTNFTIFEKNRTNSGAGLKGLTNKGFYFTDTKQGAEQYAIPRGERGVGETPGVKEVYLNMTNPLIVDSVSKEGIKQIKDKFGIKGNKKITFNNIDNYVNEMLYDDAYNLRSEEQRQAYFNSTGYDGVILKGQYGDEYVVFNSNQIKNVDNLNPTENPDIRYSKDTEGWTDYVSNTFTKDNTGRELSKKQQEYFKDSKIRNDKGDLEVFYHGSNNEFNVFDSTRKPLFNNNNVNFFTNNKDIADTYGKNKYELYIKSTNPYVLDGNTDGYSLEYSTTGQQELFNNKSLKPIKEKLDKNGGTYYKKSVAKICDTILTNKNNVLSSEEIQYLEDHPLSLAYLSVKAKDGFAPYGKGVMTNDLVNAVLSINKNTNNKYDSVLFKSIKDSGQYYNNNTKAELSDVIATFEPNQIKNVDNLNPTDDPDIRYSINEENTLKEKQNDIIQKANPKDESLGEHTWINSVDDIKTYQEALEYDDYEGGELTPDFTEDMLNKALETGKMTVYSSYPIEQGTFVTPSKMEAESYAGSGKVYSKEINLTDVAWIDSLQGQYAKVDGKYSKDNSTWREYLEKEFPSQGTRTNLQDINERNKPKQENKTTQEEKPQEMPKNEVKQEVKKSYLTSAEQQELDGLKALDESGLAENKDLDRIKELERKQQGITKKFPELKTKNTFDDIKSIYGKYKNNEISKQNKKVLQEAKNIIEANKQGRRTIEEWKQVAEYIGSNADIKNSQDLQKLAMETWFNQKPNNPQNLNRQGKKYVKFGVDDWVNAVYKGAGVGTDVKLSQEEKPQEIPKNPVADSVKAMNLEKENIKYSAEEKIEKSVRNQYKGLSEDKIQQIIELKEEQKEKDKMYSNFSNKQRAKQRIMINAYETNAKIRKIVQGDSLQKVKGGLTDTELANAIEKENSNYIGKKVTVDGQNGTVVGNPYGRVKVEFEDGTTKTFDRDEVKSMNETKKDKIVEAKDTEGNKIDLKPTKKGTYERVNTPKTKEVMPKIDFENKTVKVGNKNVSNFYSNVTEKSKFIDIENRLDLMDNDNIQYYDAISNKETLKSAMKNLDKNSEQAIGDFFTKEKFTPEDVATGWILVKRYQDAGNFEAMSKVLEKMREQGTQAGQTVQMYGILQRLTPEGMEYYAQKQLDNAYKEFSQNKSKKQIEKYAEDFTLTAEEHQFIKDQMEKVEKLTDDEAKKVEIAKVVKMLSDKMPPSKGSRLKAIMRLSMLGNPKTQVRNVVGNAIIQPVNWGGDVFATVADKIIAKKTGVRTKGLTQFDKLAKGSLQGLQDSIRDAKTGVDTRDIDLNKFEDSIQAKPFYENHKGKGAKALNTLAKTLNKTSQALTNVMSGGDRIFYQAVFNNSLENQMRLNKVDIPTQDMIEIAKQEALSRTLNDSNAYTDAVIGIRRYMNKLNVKGYGLGDVLIPFAKTPANLTKAIVDYSPVGLARTILQDGRNLRNSLENGQYSPQLQQKFVDSLGKGTAGTILWALAYAAAQAGIVTGASDDDKDVSNFMRNTLGIQPYSIKIGNKSFTYDWAQPIAAPFAAMADAKKLSETDQKELASTIKSMANSSFSILMEQSFLRSISEVFNNYDGPFDAIMKQIEGLPARAVPTFFKQIADLIDPTSRQTYLKGNEGKMIVNQAQVKLPGASKKLTANRDTLGREIKKYGGDDNKLQYAFNVFLNPANTNKGKVSEAGKEIYEVYKATKDKGVMPRQANYSESIGGETRNLTAKERNRLQKASGEMVEKNVKQLSKNSTYNSMSDEDKAEVIKGIVNYSFAKAKSEEFDVPLANIYSAADKAVNNGTPLYDYYIEKNMNNDIKRKIEDKTSTYMKEMKKSTEYKNLTRSEKDQVERKVQYYTKSVTNSEELNKPISRTYKAAYNAEQNGMAIYNYYISQIKK